jgi:Rhodopsin-like GPCR transmembrane domain
VLAAVVSVVARTSALVSLSCLSCNKVLFDGSSAAHSADCTRYTIAHCKHTHTLYAHPPHTIRRYDASAHKSHYMDSWPGKLLVLLRLCLLGLFLSGGMVTLNNEVTHKRRDFVHRLLIAGTGWFAALPLVVLVASICAPYLREQVSVLCRTEQYSVALLCLLV